MSFEDIILTSPPPLKHDLSCDLYAHTNTSLKTLSLAFEITALMLVIISITIMPDLAYAQTDTPMGSVLCTVVKWFTGNTGKGLASIAVCVIGIGAMLGKVSWGMAMIVGIGISIVFGSGEIVNALGRAEDSDQCDITT